MGSVLSTIVAFDTHALVVCWLLNVDLINYTVVIETLPVDKGTKRAFR